MPKAAVREARKARSKAIAQRELEAHKYAHAIAEQKLATMQLHQSSTPAPEPADLLESGAAPEPTAAPVSQEPEGVEERTERRVEVEPNDKYTHSVRVVPGMLVSWRFTSTDYDIGFGYQWCDAQGAPNPDQSEIQMERCDSHQKEHSGSVLSAINGNLLLIWDNSYSWINRKGLQFSVSANMSQEFETNCMMQALAEAKKCPSHPFGCVLLQRTTGSAIAAAHYNESLFMGPLWRDIMIALEKVNREQDPIDTSDLVLYCTAEPDMMSWGAISLYGISKVVYGVALSETCSDLTQVPLEPSHPLRKAIHCSRFFEDPLSECKKAFELAATHSPTK